jgi:hypothetical protein
MESGKETKDKITELKKGTQLKRTGKLILVEYDPNGNEEDDDANKNGYRTLIDRFLTHYIFMVFGHDLEAFFSNQHPYARADKKQSKTPTAYQTPCCTIHRKPPGNLCKLYNTHKIKYCSNKH